MANLKEVRSRIDSVNSTKQITSAMKMVSAAKLRKAQRALHNMRPYALKLTEIVDHISASLGENIGSIYTEQRAPEKVLIVAIASNRGLSGPFNANVAKEAMEHLLQNYRPQFEAGQVDIFTIGKRVFEFLKSRKIDVARRNDQLLDDLSFENVEALAQMLQKEFADGKYDRIDIVYNQFKNAAVQLLTIEQLLPIAPQESISDSAKEKSNIYYLFEPSKEEILLQLIPKALTIQLYKALLDSAASEHGARMTAMHKATDNADELIKSLRLSYNKARQAAITNEILEIVSGAEALR
ncbi:MAG TPA: ATP synthase F1 subunit gamma [Bacteroidales bacterium]|nr:ATP synthase F1 subunit gamma [Bacteroidales bacterium]